MNDIIHAGKHFLTYNVSRHKHNNWELIYCTEKCGKFIFDDLEIPYSVGDIVAIPPDTPHRNVSENGFTNIHLNVDNTTLPFRQPFMIQDDSNQTLLHLFSDVHYLYRGDRADKADFLVSYGNLIVHFITSIASKHAHQRNPIVDQIEQSILQNYTDVNYKLDEKLDAMPYCSDYLCRIFRKEKGTTPHKYLNSLRLQSAASMLRSDYSTSSIAEVANLCGFRNPLYFSRLFKKKYQLSPREYALTRPASQPGGHTSQKISLPE